MEYEDFKIIWEEPETNNIAVRLLSGRYKGAIFGVTFETWPEDLESQVRKDVMLVQKEIEPQGGPMGAL